MREQVARGVPSVPSLMQHGFPWQIIRGTKTQTKGWQVELQEITRGRWAVAAMFFVNGLVMGA